jgi:hypothetical protein
MDFAILVSAFSAIVTKLVDLVRTAFDKNDAVPKWIWIVLALVFGVGIALLYDLDYTEAIQGLPDKFATASETWSEVLTGLGIGALASGFHELFDALSGIAKRGNPPPA